MRHHHLIRVRHTLTHSNYLDYNLQTDMPPNLAHRSDSSPVNNQILSEQIQLKVKTKYVNFPQSLQELLELPFHGSTAHSPTGQAKHSGVFFSFPSFHRPNPSLYRNIALCIPFSLSQIYALISESSLISHGQTTTVSGLPYSRSLLLPPRLCFPLISYTARDGLLKTPDLIHPFSVSSRAGSPRLFLPTFLFLKSLFCVVLPPVWSLASSFLSLLLH